MGNKTRRKNEVQWNAQELKKTHKNTMEWNNWKMTTTVEMTENTIREKN